LVEHLAGVALTKSGAKFDPAADQWVFEDDLSRISLDFTKLPGLSAELLLSAKATLRWYAENRSSAHLENLFTRLQHFARAIAKNGQVIDSIAATDILNYQSGLDTSTSWYVGTLAGLLRKWHGLGYGGVGADALLLLKQLRLKGNTKGVAVLTMDPLDGPYTHIEVEGLQTALNSAYAGGQLKAAEYVLAWLYLLLGQRNKQYAALKVCDAQVKRDTDGNLSYSVMVPSAKKGTANARDRMVERPLIEQFGAMLVEYAQSVRALFEGVLADAGQAPLFPSGRVRQSVNGFEFHRTADDLGQLLKRSLENLQVRSERTGKVINVTARRFRRTIGTRAAEEGHGPLVIAGLLDHADTQHVGVYTANSPAIIERIDRAIAMDMAPLAQAFAGTVMNGSADGATSTNRIIDLRIDRSGKAMGKCGQEGYCGFAAPVACYTCRNFEAWVDGPHEAVLTYLLARREQLLKLGDKRMASVNDRTILAVAAVIQCCNATRHLENQAGG